MTLSSGDRLGAFKIHSPLGKGGMGEVYRATDTRLNRDVAIKVLPGEVGSDPERLARFEREARILAALNHPNIAHVYGFERAARADGEPISFLAMELVPGEDLAERLVRGAIPIDETLAIARQVAGALEQAHESGIVHRDLKPGNIKITPDGTVKVLDFGLAKATSGDPSGAPVDLSHSPTFAQTGTQAGVILGTAAYMSPEQVRGKPLDSRTDIWAFGVVLFEMLAGERLFAGETVSDLLAAVLRADLDWGALPSNTPPRLEALIRRCLERDPKRRLRDIGEARIALEDITAGVSDTPVVVDRPPPAPVSRATWPWLIALVGAVVLGLVVGRFAMTPALPNPRPVRFEITAGAVSSAVLSPDGTQLAIAAQGHLWVRDLARLETRAIDGTDGAVRPFWSPDGHTIAYGARGKLWKVAADAGAPSALCDLVGGLWDDDAGGAWLSNGTIVYSNGNAGLWQVSAQGGDPVVVLAPDPQRELHFHTASVLPDGRSVVYTVHRSGEGVGTNTVAVWSNGKAQVVYEVAAGQSLDDPVFSPSGHILFQRSPINAGVWALPFSVETLKATGEPFLVAQGMRGPSVASNGTLALLPPLRRRPLSLAWVDRQGKLMSRIDEPRFRPTAAAISPEGDRVVSVEVNEGKADIWLYDIRRNARTRLTSDGDASNPAWMPDGRTILYEGAAGNRGSSIKRVSADGSGRALEVLPGRRPRVSSDGTTVFYGAADKDGVRLWYRSLVTKDAMPLPFLAQPFYSISASPSPDGRFIAYDAEPGPDQSEIYLRRFPPSDEMWQVSTSGGTTPRWSSDGRLFFAKGGDVFEVDITTDRDVRVGAPRHLFTRTPSGGAAVPSAFEVSPDGTRFLVYEPVGDVTDERIQVVLNWSPDVTK